jgi:hypothetical protein
MSETTPPYNTNQDPQRAEIELLLDIAFPLLGKEDRGQAYLQTALVSGLLLLTDRLAKLIDTIDNLSNHLGELLNDNPPNDALPGSTHS